MLRRFRFVIMGAAMVLASAAASYAAVSAAMPDALLASGTTRYAAAYSTTYESNSWTAGWVDLHGMTKYITIPSGHTADVMVIFCGTASTDASGTLYVRALIRDVVASPNEIALAEHDSLSHSQCAMFYKTDVTPGSPAVKVQWSAGGGGAPGVFVNRRSMLVIVNIH